MQRNQAHVGRKANRSEISMKIINDEALATVFKLRDLSFKREDISETQRKELVDYNNKVPVESFNKHYVSSDSTIKNQTIEKFLLDEM